MPDYLIYSLSNFLNLMSEGLYFVMERSSARQSTFSEERDKEEPDPDSSPEEEEEEEDCFLSYLFIFLSYFR